MKYNVILRDDCIINDGKGSLVQLGWQLQDYLFDHFKYKPEKGTNFRYLAWEDSAGKHSKSEFLIECEEADALVLKLCFPMIDLEKCLDNIFPFFGGELYWFQTK